MVKVKTSAQIDKVHDKTIRLLKNMLNDAIASKKITKALQKKGYKIKEVAHPHEFIMRRLKMIK